MMVRLGRPSALYLLASLLVVVGGAKQTSAFQQLQLQPRSLALTAFNGNLNDVRISQRKDLQSVFVSASYQHQHQLHSNPRRSVQLYSTNGLPSAGNERPNRGGGRKNPLARAAKKLMSVQARLFARFQALPTRAKRLFIANMFFFCVAFGGISRNVYRQSAPPPPVEIAYSSFLDLVEQQQQQSLPGGKSISDVPVMDQVRIGTDRIAYRLYRNVDGKTTAPVVMGSKNQPQPQAQPQKSGLSSNRNRSKKAQAPAPYLMAYTRKVPASADLVDTLRKSEISFSAATAPRTSVLILAIRSFMVAFYGLILWRLYGTISGAGGGGMGGAKDSPGKLAQGNDLPLASFDDIQGIDQAKVEVMELVDALRNPDKYAILGARAPTGLLLEGPPGTGKTMLARATAATAGVPLLYCSGSDFVEMFVGRGAARVRKLFERADKLSPCIIFIDELDALGKARDSGFAGSFSRSNDEAEQTLNQLLACMDGLDSSRRICVLAATNRKEVLDQALIRPGRFDRLVKLTLPDSNGRVKILRVHCSKLPGFVEGTGIDGSRLGSLGKGRVVDLSAVAAITDGFSGAELEFLVNEAAIRAVRRVSAALREGTATKDITPHVEAGDFEESLRNFYQTRKPKIGVGEIWKSMMK